jgi:hypothetical protein
MGPLTADVVLDRNEIVSRRRADFKRKASFTQWAILTAAPDQDLSV